MVKKILLIGSALVVVLVTVIMTRPDDFRITRTITVNAPSGVVFDLINDFHRWDVWSPWAKLDPQAKNSFEGPANGIGATFSWQGNDQVGTGKQTIIESKPNELVKIRLEFFKPFQATNTALFTLTQQGDETFVAWSMYGKNNFMGKAMSLLMNCDKMVGGQFEKGLAQLKATAEQSK